MLGFVEELVKQSVNVDDTEGIVAGTLLVRQACLEGPHVFMSYTDWFQVNCLHNYEVTMN